VAGRGHTDDRIRISALPWFHNDHRDDGPGVDLRYAANDAIDPDSDCPDDDHHHIDEFPNPASLIPPPERR